MFCYLNSLKFYTLKLKIFNERKLIKEFFLKKRKKENCVAGTLAISQNQLFEPKQSFFRFSYGMPLGIFEMDDQFLPFTLLFSSTALIGIGIGLFASKFNILYLWKHKVDKTNTQNGGELVAEVLKSHKVENIFTLVGGHISPILVAAEKIGIKVIDTRHEVNCVFAADAVARMTGTVGVAAVTAGPGLTNTVTAVKNAQMAESPVLLLGGAAATLLKGRGSLQDIDQLSLFEPLCKYCATVRTVRDIVPTLLKAIQIAQSGTPGPVFVELPLDVLYPYSMVSKEMGMKENPKSLGQKIVSWYLDNYLSNIFAGAWEKRDTAPLNVNIPFASHSTGGRDLPEAGLIMTLSKRIYKSFKHENSASYIKHIGTGSSVSSCAGILSSAKKPVIVVGSQATLPPTPVDEVKKALERIGVPCFLGGMARGLLGHNSRLHMRQNRKTALKEADVIVLAGSICDFRLSYGRGLNPKAKIIVINRDKKQALKNSDMFWKPTTCVIGDVGTFLKDLSALLPHDFNVDDNWVDVLKQRDVEKESATKKMSTENLESRLNPINLFLELEKVLPQNSILVADGGDFVATASYILRPRGPLTWLDPGAFGTLGVGAGFAMGAKLSRPDSQVWIIYGDGSLGYSLMEFDTMIRHEINVIALVGNDAGWTQIEREQLPMFNSSVACTLKYTDYHDSIKGLGAEGFILKQGDDIVQTLKNAQKICDDRPVLVNAIIGKSKFREGSISI